MATLAEKDAEILAILEAYDSSFPGGWVIAPMIHKAHSLRLTYPTIISHLAAMVKAGSVEMKRGPGKPKPHMYRIARIK